MGSWNARRLASTEYSKIHSRWEEIQFQRGILTTRVLPWKFRGVRFEPAAPFSSLTLAKSSKLWNSQLDSTKRGSVPARGGIELLPLLFSHVRFPRTSCLYLACHRVYGVSRRANPRQTTLFSINRGTSGRSAAVQALFTHLFIYLFISFHVPENFTRQEEQEECLFASVRLFQRNEE